MLYCSNCRGQLPPEGTFCPNCGTPWAVATNPLGPKTLGGIFGGTFRIYGAGFLGIVTIVAVVQVPLSLLGFWLFGLDPTAFGPSFFDPSMEPPIDPSFGIPILLIATLLSSVIMNGALIYGVSGQILGKPILVGRAYSFALGRFGAMLGAQFLAVLAAFLMAVTIIGFPFAIYFIVGWFCVLQTASLERCGPLAALARSSDLVRGNWWRVFGILLLIVILLAIANGIAYGILGLITLVGPLLIVVIAVLFAPVMTITQTLLYHDLRVRRDGLAGYAPDVLARELENSGAL